VHFSLLRDDDDDDDDDNKPVRLTWAVGALFRGTRRIHINRICFHITPGAVNDEVDNKPLANSGCGRPLQGSILDGFT
jgi:hypothetical protein